MGEEQKEEEKKEEPPKEEEKKEEAPEPPEIVLKVDMHCEGCAKKVQKSLRKFEGVEEVKADSRAKTVVVKGKAADPAKICERVQRKTGRRVELISPLPPPPKEEKKEEPPKEAPPPEEKKEEPKPITVVLKIRMHCEACAQILQKRIKKMEGVESVETDIANDQILVKGIFDPNVLVEHVHKRTGRQALIVPEEEKKEEEKKEEEKKEEEKKEEEKKNEEPKEEELKKYDYWHPFPHVEYAYPAYPAYPAYHAYHAYQPPHIQYDSYPLHHAQYGLYAQPQVFSDENPNACSVM